MGVEEGDRETRKRNIKRCAAPHDQGARPHSRLEMLSTWGSSTLVLLGHPQESMVPVWVGDRGFQSRMICMWQVRTTAGEMRRVQGTHTHSPPLSHTPHTSQHTRNTHLIVAIQKHGVRVQVNGTVRLHVNLSVESQDSGNA